MSRTSIPFGGPAARRFRRHQRPRSTRMARDAARWFGIAALAGAAIGLAPAIATRSSQPTYGETVAGCVAVDGDTLRCGGERIRLLGIDSPELPGHCHAGRHCVAGDPFAATDMLAAALRSSLSIRRVGTDHYGRTLAVLGNEGGDLSCWQLRHGAAVYKPRWDNGGLVMRACPDAT